jgi:SMC interacting uncharacterized protein involved in chromosome segregation
MQKLTKGKSPDFLLKTSTTNLRKQGLNDSTNQSRYVVCRERIQKIENKVAQLQQEMIDVSQKLQLEYQMERYLDQELAVLQNKVTEEREIRQRELKKPKVLSKDLDTMLTKKKHLQQAMNDAAGKITTARTQIKEMR